MQAPADPQVGATVSGAWGSESLGDGGGCWFLHLDSSGEICQFCDGCN